MGRRFYQTGQLARKALVTERTLRYYDKLGLLSPSEYSEAGYRLYTDEDLVNLQQILALKFLGFSLDEIRILLRNGPEQMLAVLAQQKAMMHEKRAQLDTVIQAIAETEQLLQKGKCDWDSITKVIQVIQMEQDKDWVKKYLTDEQRQMMEELSKKAYSEEARRKIAARGQNWTEADQQRADEQWGWVNTELKRLVAAGADPAGSEAQAWVKFRSDLLSQFTGNDPEITAGLRRWWQNYFQLPEGERPLQMAPNSDAETEFIERATAIYNQSRQS